MRATKSKRMMWLAAGVGAFPVLFSGSITKADVVIDNFSTNAFTSVTGLTITAVSTGNSAVAGAVASGTPTSSGAYTDSSGNAASGGNFFGFTVNPKTTSVGATTPYYTFSITASAGNIVSLTDVDFGARSSTTGPPKYDLYASTDNFATSSLVYSTNVSIVGNTWAYYDNASFTAITTAAAGTLTLRLYTYNNSSTAGTTRIDDVILNVSAVSANAPEYFNGAGGAGSWDTSSNNWSTAATAGTPEIYSSSKPVYFAGATGGQVVVGSGISVGGGSINFNTTGYSLTGGSIDMSTDTIIVTAQNVIATIDSSLTGSGSVTKSGLGSVTLNGANTYQGNTTISTGTVILGGSLSNTPSVSVSGTLATTGASASIGGNVTVNSGGTLNIGGTGTGGALTSGAITFAAGSSLLFDLSIDSINLGANALAAGGNISFGGTATPGTKYSIFTAGSVTGNFTVAARPTNVGYAAFDFTSGVYSVTFSKKGNGAAPTSFPSSTVYRQNFDSLANTGTANDISTLPSGFKFVKTGTPTQTTYSTDDGSAQFTAGVYSYGTAGSTERALGSVASNTTGNIYIGVNLTNNSGGQMSQIGVSYTGEQWHSAQRGDGSADELKFEYSLDATSLTDGTWTEVGSLNFFSPKTAAGTPIALDGNDPTNQLLLTGTIDLTNSPIAIGEGFWLRWTDINLPSANDDGLAIDNLSVTPEPTSMGFLCLAGIGMLARRKRKVSPTVAL